MEDLQNISANQKRRSSDGPLHDSLDHVQHDGLSSIPDAFNIPDELLCPVERSMRDAWKALIMSRKQSKYLFTVGFKDYGCDDRAINSLRFFLKAIGRSLFNHDFAKFPGAAFNGICIVEPHMHRQNFHGQCHFHLLIDKISGVKSIDSLRSVIWEEMPKVKTTNGFPMLDENVVDLREIWEIDVLADYLTKTARMHKWKRMDNICFVDGKHGLLGPCIGYKGNSGNY